MRRYAFATWVLEEHRAYAVVRHHHTLHGEQAVEQGGWLASELLGFDVRSGCGGLVGHVDDILLDWARMRVRSIVARAFTHRAGSHCLRFALHEAIPSDGRNCLIMARGPRHGHRM